MWTYPIVGYCYCTSIIGSSSPQPSVHSTKHMGPILETAMQRAPMIHLQAGNIQAAIDCYRYFFSLNILVFLIHSQQFYLLNYWFLLVQEYFNCTRNYSNSKHKIDINSTTWGNFIKRDEKYYLHCSRSSRCEIK